MWKQHLCFLNKWGHNQSPAGKNWNCMLNKWYQSLVAAQEHISQSSILLNFYWSYIALSSLKTNHKCVIDAILIIAVLEPFWMFQFLFVAVYLWQFCFCFHCRLFIVSYVPSYQLFSDLPNKEWRIKPKKSNFTLVLNHSKSKDTRRTDTEREWWVCEKWSSAGKAIFIRRILLTAQLSKINQSLSYCKNMRSTNSDACWTAAVDAETKPTAGDTDAVWIRYCQISVIYKLRRTCPSLWDSGVNVIFY